MRAPRVSERERFLESENASLRDRLNRLTANPPEIPFAACDNSCVVARAEGMATNGGCRCDERKLRHAVTFWRAVAAHRLAVVDALKLSSGDRINDLDQRVVDLEALLSKHGAEIPNDQ